MPGQLESWAGRRTSRRREPAHWHLARVTADKFRPHRAGSTEPGGHVGSVAVRCSHLPQGATYRAGDPKRLLGSGWGVAQSLNVEAAPEATSRLMGQRSAVGISEKCLRLSAFGRRAD